MMIQNYEFSLGELAYTIRKLNGLTQVDYSKRLGVVQSTVSKVEKDIFDDVPFSLVSRISTEFNIPLNYFQAGLLPIRRTNNIYKTIPKVYINEGVFKAKTIFYILKELSKTYEGNLYKDLKLPEQFLCLSNLNYSFEFINKLYSLTQDFLQDSIKQIQIESPEAIVMEHVFHYLSSIHGIITGNISGKDITFPNGIEFTLSNTIHDLDTIYAEILRLEISILFNANFALSPSTAPNEFVLTKEIASVY